MEDDDESIKMEKVKTCGHRKNNVHFISFSILLLSGPKTYVKWYSWIDELKLSFAK